MESEWVALAELLSVLGRGILSESDADDLFRVLRRALDVDAIVAGQEWGRFGGFLRADGVPKDWPEAYQRLQHQDPGQAFLLARPMGRWFFIRADSTPEQLDTELHRTFLDMGFKDGAITQLPSSGAPITLVLYRTHEGAREFDAADRVRLEMLHPHFQQGFGRARSARAWRGEAIGDRSTGLRELPHARVDLLDGGVVFSAKAKTLFESLLAAPFTRAQTKLAQMVAHVVAKDVGGAVPLVGDVYGEVLTLRDADGRTTEAIVLFERGAVLPEVDLAISPAEELLSPKQRRVARLAASGMPLRRVAEVLDLSVETARTHLKSVYERLGVTERSSLSHLLR